MLRHRPVGEVNRVRALVIEFNEWLGSAGAELVDLDGKNITNFLCRGIGAFAAGADPGSVGYQVAVEGRLAGRDIKGRAYTGIGCNWRGERRGTRRDGSPAFGGVKAQFYAGRLFVSTIGKGDGCGGRGSGRKSLHPGWRIDRRRRRQAEGLHCVLCGDYVGLDLLVGGVRWEGVRSE